MPAGSMSAVLQHVRGFFRRRDSAARTDADLLEAFQADRDQAAFATLVERHGPMVLGVCRRILHDAHDAEDAFQATFLVLVRKADSVRPRALVGNWLYGVAQRTARKSRTLRAQRQARERMVVDVPAPLLEPAELNELLDEELGGLPDRYRAALVLCALEGRSRADAARHLGVAEGTLSSRLARGRELLGQRLARRGVGLSVGALTALLSPQALAKSAPPALVAATVQAAAFATAGEAVAAGVVPGSVALLTEGVLQTMNLSMTKLTLVALLVLAVMGAGAGVFVHQALADKPAVEAPVKKPANDAAPVQDEKKKPEVGDSTSGHVKAVDKNTITLATKADKQKGEKTYDLAKDIKVLLLEGLVKNEEPKEGKLSDVAPGDNVSLQMTADNKSVAVIRPHGQTVGGRVQSVDAAKGKLTLTLKGKDSAEEKTFQVAEGTRVLLSDGLKKDEAPKEAKLADLTEGQAVQARLSVFDRTKIVALRVQANNIQGAVKGVDVGNKSITITVKEDGGVVEKTFTVSKDARLAVALADLVEGARVVLVFSVFDGKTVAALNVVEDK